MTNDELSGKKPDKEEKEKEKKGGKCKTKILLTFENIDPTIDQVLTLGEYTKTKTPEDLDGETTTSFMVQFKGKEKMKALGKKPTDAVETYCPKAGETLIGDLNGFPISVTIQKTKGNAPTKVTYDIGYVAPLLEASQQEEEEVTEEE